MDKIEKISIGKQQNIPIKATQAFVKVSHEV